MKEINTVYETREYDSFKNILGNRIINPRNLKKLVFSMKEKQLKIPVIVNHEFEVIDGQHRVEACKHLGLPIPFVIVDGYGLEDVQRANQTVQKWTVDDKVNLYVAQNNKAYIKLKEIKEKYNIPTIAILNIYAKATGVGASEIKGMFDQGKFSSPCEDVIDMFLKQLQDFDGYTQVSRHSFISAFADIFFIKEPFQYDHSIMLAKLPRYGAELSRATSKMQILDTLCNSIYSIGLKKNKLCYNYKTNKFHM